MEAAASGGAGRNVSCIGRPAGKAVRNDCGVIERVVDQPPPAREHLVCWGGQRNFMRAHGRAPCLGQPDPFLDRKSTRLNSSHVAISYAVFCLKKKKQN